jgi:hypothetical protein
MKHLIISLFILSAGQAFSQIEEKDSTCNAYDKKIDKALKEEATFEMPNIHIHTVLSKRAIGPVDHDIVIYFDEYEVEIGPDGMGNFHKEAVIRKVEFTISSVSYTIQNDYYFDSGGMLIKHVESEMGYRCAERSTYFEDKEAIGIKLKPLSKKDAPCDEKEEAYDKTNLTKTEKAEASWILDEAKKFREILFLQYEIVKN